MSVAELDRPAVRAADPVAQFTEMEKSFVGVHRDIDAALKAASIHINSDQALVLARLGTAEMVVGDLIASNAYIGSNVSYNVRKLVEALYLDRWKSPYDGREHYVKCTPSGVEVGIVVRKALAQSQDLSRVRVLA